MQHTCELLERPIFQGGERSSGLCITSMSFAKGGLWSHQVVLEVLLPLVLPGLSLRIRVRLRLALKQQR